MTTVWQAAVAIAASLVLVWLLLIIALYVGSRRSAVKLSATDVLRLLPDVLRLVKRLAVDRSLPRRVRWSLWGLLGYVVLPIDLVPDFLPVVGQLDDVIVVVIVLRGVIRAAGSATIERHWPGTPEGLHVVLSVSGQAAARRG
ncbi:DUF1232 domain-containing protein [Nocardioides sp. AN3]